MQNANNPAGRQNNQSNQKQRMRKAEFNEGRKKTTAAVCVSSQEAVCSSNAHQTRYRAEQPSLNHVHNRTVAVYRGDRNRLVRIPADVLRKCRNLERNIRPHSTCQPQTFQCQSCQLPNSLIFSAIYTHLPACFRINRINRVLKDILW